MVKLKILVLFAAMAVVSFFVFSAPDTPSKIDTSDWSDLSAQKKTPEPAVETAAQILAAEIEAEAPIIESGLASHAEVDALCLDTSAGSTDRTERSTIACQTCMDMVYGKLTRARLNEDDIEAEVGAEFYTPYFDATQERTDVVWTLLPAEGGGKADEFSKRLNREAWPRLRATADAPRQTRLSTR